MSPSRMIWSSLTLSCLSLATLAGCGGSDQPAADSTGGDETAAHSGTAPPTTSIGSGQQGQKAPGKPAPEKGSPEWFVGEMIVLWSQPLALPAPTNNPEKLEAARQERNHKIIEMASGVIARTYKDPSKESAFNDAVHFLVESRLQLALAGDETERAALYEDAAALYNRDPESKAAADAAYAVARYVHTNAQRFAKKEPQRLAEFAKQARLFATNFPMHQARALQLLLSAGRSCELHGIRDEAIACYAMIQEKFPDAQQAKQAAAILRRLNLKGQKLDLGGETPEGGYVKIGDYEGKVVLVVFWSSDSQAFQQQLPQLTEVVQKYEKRGLSVIGISLDEDETLVDQFVVEHPLPWTQIFSVDRDKRRWDHPVVKAYGVQDIPLYWLVDKSGTVVENQIQPEELDSRIRSLLAKKSASAQ